MTYIEMAQEHGFTGSNEKLEYIGMAIERAECAWSWFEAGEDKHDVAAIFAYRDEAPNYEDTIAAYADAADNEYTD